MMTKPRFSSLLTVAVLLAGLVVFGPPTPARAGCGCDKPPPLPAAIRPEATYAGREVTLFHSALQSGQTYTVRFTSGTTGQTAMVQAQAITRRDPADGKYKPQLVVPVPALPLGPTSITVQAGTGGDLITFLDDAAFTVAPQPIVIPEQSGKYQFKDFQAAVSRDGVVYISLDLSAMTEPRVLQAQAKGYPLRFTGDDVVFYNTQGFLMQMLDGNIPGLFTVTPPQSAGEDSDILRYSRHEFNTFFLQHDERQPHHVDATDPNWHLDGTPHIDHNRLIMAIAGRLRDGSLPVPGATRLFHLDLRTFSLFYHGVVGETSVSMSGRSVTDSYDSNKADSFGFDSHVFSNGEVRLSENANVRGNATAKKFALSGSAKVTANKITVTQPMEFIPVYMPSHLESLGSLVVNDTKRILLVGPASYQVSDLIVRDSGKLEIDTSAGPVTLYVTGRVEVADRGTIIPSDQNPEKFALYVTGGGSVKFNGNGIVHGVVYAPESLVEFAGKGNFFGAVVGRGVTMREDAVVHYDVFLKKKAKKDGLK